MILITGSTGFIGKNLSSFLRRRQEGIIHAPHSLFEMNAKEQREYMSANRVSCLIHLASVGVTDRHKDYTEVFNFNVIKSQQIIESALVAGCDQIIVAGSCFEYGLTGNTIECLNVDDKLMPVGYHAISKATLFLNIKEKVKDMSDNVAYLRIFQAYGENEHPSRLYPSLCSAAREGKDFPMSDGKQVRDFIHVDDVCAYVEKCIGGNSGWNVYNVCSGVPMTVLEFAEMHWQMLDAKGRLRPGQLTQKESELKRLVGKKTVIR